MNMNMNNMKMIINTNMNMKMKMKMKMIMIIHVGVCMYMKQTMLRTQHSELVQVKGEQPQVALPNVNCYRPCSMQ